MRALADGGLTSEQLREEQRRLPGCSRSGSGRAAGLAAAQKEIDAKLQRTRRTGGQPCRLALHALARPLAQIDDVVHEQITMLALEAGPWPAAA